jgi:hypothetical protein
VHESARFCGGVGGDSKRNAKAADREARTIVRTVTAAKLSKSGTGILVNRLKRTGIIRPHKIFSVFRYSVKATTRGDNQA